jgi:hypothetical protein
MPAAQGANETSAPRSSFRAQRGEAWRCDQDAPDEGRAAVGRRGNPGEVDVAWLGTNEIEPTDPLGKFDPADLQLEPARQASP